MSTYKVIDNFLPEDIFAQLEQGIVWNNEFSWTLIHKVTFEEPENSDFQSLYFSHLGYFGDVPLTGLHQMCYEVCKAIGDYRALIRLKANFYPYTPDIYEHCRHIDFPYEHKGALLSLNTCNGFTRLEDGTKIESVRNRMLFFDPSKTHNSSTTNDQKGRFNIQINYF